MTIRYHARRGQQTPTYVCQRDGISHGHPPCAVIPGHTLDQQIGEFLISQLTPLAAEAALTVSAELQHRAAEADALRAAHIERARYHADLARRRYLAVDPANRLVAETLEADWNTALRALGDAQAAYDKAREQPPASSPRNRRPGSAAHHRPARHLERPRHPSTRAQAHRPPAAHRRHRDPHQRHDHRPRAAARRPDLHPVPPCPQTRLGDPPDPARRPDRHRRPAEHPHQRRDRRHPQRPGLASGQGRPYTRIMVDRVIRGYHLRPRRDRLRDTGLLTLTEMATELRVSKTTVKDWYHAGIVSGQRYNHKGEVLYDPPGPNPPALHQGRRHHTTTCMNAPSHRSLP